MSALEEENFLEKGENQTYRPGVMLFHLGKVAEKDNSIRNLSSPVLKDLSKKFKCASHLAYLEGKEVVYLDKHVSNPFFEFASKIGMRIPAYATALGKAILAYKEDEVLEEMYKDVSFEAFTPNTIIKFHDFMKELHLTRSRGYAVDNEEICLGLKCYAVPIINYKDEVEAAISLSKPVSLVDGNEEKELINSLKDAGIFISDKLGRRLGKKKIVRK